MVIKRYLLLVMLVPLFGYAQQLPLRTLKAKKDRYLEQKTFFRDHQLYELGAGMDFTSFIIQIDDQSSFDGAYVILNRDTITL